MPHYLNEMENLINTAPEVHQQFIEGHFGVNWTSGKFNVVWIDMALEKTYNCESKKVLFHGITQQQATMEKYIKSFLILTAVLKETKNMAHICQTKK